MSILIGTLALALITTVFVPFALLSPWAATPIAATLGLVVFRARRPGPHPLRRRRIYAWLLAPYLAICLWGALFTKSGHQPPAPAWQSHVVWALAGLQIALALYLAWHGAPPKQAWGALAVLFLAFGVTAAGVVLACLANGQAALGAL